MSKLRDAAQQALEALEDHAKQYPHMQKGYTVDAIAALRAALAEQPAEQGPVAWMTAGGDVSRSKLWCDERSLGGEPSPLYTAPQPKREPVEATPYNLKRIAWELERTAVGDGFYGNALRVAKDMPGITMEDRSVLDRYATGTQTGTDHVDLQWLALRLYNKDDSKNGVQT